MFIVDGDGIKKAKGIKKNFVKSMRQKEYVDELVSRVLVRHEEHSK